MSDTMSLRAGTRGSRLALWQTDLVASRLRQAWPGLQVERVLITTLGDRVSDVPLPRIGDKGIFTRELEDALRAGTIDLAVHSLKDLPTELPPGLVIAAILERADPRDALVGPSPVTIDTLRAGARVGTSSLRRRAQLLARRPDLDVRDLRGNVPTRVDKVLAGDLDAAVLALAGLTRLGLSDHVVEVFGTDVMLPAPGQGALAVEIRADDQRTAAWVAPLDDRDTRLATTAERTMLAQLEGGCQAPIGALATFADVGILRLEGTGHRPGWTRRRAPRGRGAGDRPRGRRGARAGRCGRFACWRRRCHPGTSAADADERVEWTRPSHERRRPTGGRHASGRRRSVADPRACAPRPARVAGADCRDGPAARHRGPRRRDRTLIGADWLVFTSARAAEAMCGAGTSGSASGRRSAGVSASPQSGPALPARWRARWRRTLGDRRARGQRGTAAGHGSATPAGLAGRRLIWPRSDVACRYLDGGCGRRGRAGDSSGRVPVPSRCRSKRSSLWPLPSPAAPSTRCRSARLRVRCRCPGRLPAARFGT